MEIKSPTWASEWVALRAGEGDSLSSSTEKWRIHSAQSSLVLRWLLSHARRSPTSFTGSRAAPFTAPRSQAKDLLGSASYRIYVYALLHFKMLFFAVNFSFHEISETSPACLIHS